MSNVVFTAGDVAKASLGIVFLPRVLIGQRSHEVKVLFGAAFGAKTAHYGYLHFRFLEGREGDGIKKYLCFGVMIRALKYPYYSFIIPVAKSYRFLFERSSYSKGNCSC